MRTRIHTFKVEKVILLTLITIMHNGNIPSLRIRLCLLPVSCCYCNDNDFGVRSCGDHQRSWTICHNNSSSLSSSSLLSIRLHDAKKKKKKKPSFAK